MRKRNGRGTVWPRKTKSGVRYYVVTSERDPVSGRQRRRYHGGHTTRRDAERHLTAVLKAQDDGDYVPPSRTTVGGFLAEWLEAHRLAVRASTRSNYRICVRAYIGPYLGEVPLQQLTGGQVTAWMAQLLETGRKDGAGLAPRRSATRCGSCTGRSRMRSGGATSPATR